jgi:hypothetical protein
MTAVTRGIEMKADDLEQRLSRFSGVLDQTLESAGDRTREIARMVAESTTSGTRAISDNFEAIRAANEDEYKHTLQAMRYFANGDSILVYYEGNSSSRADDSWIVGAGLKRLF